MRIDQISNLEALTFVAGVLVLAVLLARAVPAAGGPPSPRSWSREEITGYDAALPKYGLAALLALALGGVHAAVKTFPPVYGWLADAGRGGYLVRDLANTHLVIVIGGTVAITGLIWYALPRVLGRPLASRHLAGASFWCTVLGAGGFYLSNVVLGLVLGSMEAGGQSYAEAEQALGAWRAVPVGVSASVMGIGYWTFVANVLATVWLARRVETPRPHRHLVKFFVVGTLGLFAGTVQGVVQVMPAQEAWIQSAGAAGNYIDPISHAHVNLVTGTLVLLAALLFLASRQRLSTEAGAAARRVDDRVFWVLVPGSVAFYLVFLRLGFVEGELVRSGLSFEQAVERVGRWHTLPLAVAGTVTLAGTWALLAVLVRRFRAAPGVGGLVVAGAALLVLGTSQGLVQLVPGVKAWLESADPYGDSIANAHAQLNMLGGVMPLMLALLLGRADRLLGAPAPPELAGRVLHRLVPGVLTYYAFAMLTAVVAGTQVRAGTPPGGLVVDVLGPLGMSAGAALYAAGFAVAARFAWHASAAYRADGRVRLRRELRRYNGGSPRWAGHVPAGVFVGAEAVGALAGFPGLGWLFSGRALVGLPLALVGPGVAWALLPVLVSPYGGSALNDAGLAPILLYIVVSTAVSVVALTAVLLADGDRRAARRAVRARVPAQPGPADPQPARSGLQR